MSAPVVVHASASTPEEQVSCSAQNMCVHEQDEVDAAASISTCTDGDAYTRFRTDKYQRTPPANRDYLFAHRYGCNATSLSCPSSPSPPELQRECSASAARGDDICGTTPTHASFVSDGSESDSSLGDKATEIMGSAYNTTPPAPMSGFQSSNPAGSLGGGHKRKGSALKTVMKKLFNRRRQGVDGCRGDDGDGTEDDGDSGRSENISFSRARGTSRCSPQARAGIRSEPLRCNAPSPLTAGNVIPSKEVEDSDGIIGVAVTNDDGGSSTKPFYTRRPRTRRRATLSSAAISEVNNHAPCSRSEVEAECELNVGAPEEINRGVSPAGSLGVCQEDNPTSPDLRPRSVSAAAIREAARHVRRASDDAQISRIDARDVSPFPLLPDQGEALNYAPGYGDTTTTTDLGDEAKRASSLHSFNFGTFQRDDTSGIGQRVATVEVKLMDLELAISRLQVNVAANSSSNASVPTRRPPSPPTEVTVVRRDLRESQSSQHLSAHLSEPLFRPPTPTSMGSPNRLPEQSFATSPNPLDQFVQEEAHALPFRHPEHKPFAPHPSSMTTLDRTMYSPIEQFSDLVSMLRQEQEARKALETQVLALQRQVASLTSSSD